MAEAYVSLHSYFCGIEHSHRHEFTYFPEIEIPATLKHITKGTH